MELRSQPVPFDQDLTLSSVWAIPAGYEPKSGTGVILAHGAGAGRSHEFMVDFQRRLSEAGNLTILFNFPYKERGRRAPDPQPRLEAAFRAVLGRLRASRLHPARVFLGGKSMGGRIASYLAASGENPAGLVFLGYPLHPPGRTDKLRTSHWGKIGCPALFIQGTRDPLCDLGLLRRELEGFGGTATLHVVQGGDHSFATLKKLGRTPDQVRDEISQEIERWLSVV